MRDFAFVLTTVGAIFAIVDVKETSSERKVYIEAQYTKIDKEDPISILTRMLVLNKRTAVTSPNSRCAKTRARIPKSGRAKACLSLLN